LPDAKSSQHKRHFWIGYKLRSLINGAVVQNSREPRFYRDRLE
jgi:hypothetical protein